jgi:hypothetical protein
MKQVDAATATRNEKAVAAGKLLIEAQQRHPTEKAFDRTYLLLRRRLGFLGDFSLY